MFRRSIAFLFMNQKDCPSCCQKWKELEKENQPKACENAKTITFDV
jgi:hypothetical protein